jgi:hypothetical protein
MHKTASATPLEAAMVARRGPVTDVWLRRNIEEVDVELPEGGSQLMWVADEVTGTVAGAITAEDAASRLNRLWDELEQAALTDRELIGYHADELGGTILEVTEMISDNTGSIDDNTGAILELSEMVAELYGMVGGE